MDKQDYLNIVKDLKNSYSNIHDYTRTWEKAYKLYDIISTKEYLNDFSNRTEFAEFLNMSKGHLSRLISAIKYDKKYHFNHEKLHIDKVYVLSILGDRLYDFQKYVEEMGFTLEDIKSNDIRKMRDNYLSDGIHDSNYLKYKPLYENLLKQKNEKNLLIQISSLSETEAKNVLLFAIKSRSFDAS